MKHSARFFANHDCAYFPCHPGADPEAFNCLFCYCPLYFAPSCIGKPVWNAKGIKDCSGCREPHKPENYDRILAALSAAIRTQARLRPASDNAVQEQQDSAQPDNVPLPAPHANRESGPVSI